MMIQLFIIVFIAKLLSRLKSIQYAGLVISSTWIIVTLGNFGSDLTTGTYLELASYRLALNVLGAFLAVVLGGAVYPNLATRRSNGVVGRIVLTSAELFVAGTKAVISDRGVEANPIGTVAAADLVHMYGAVAGIEASARMRQDERTRLNHREDVRGELKFFHAIMVKNEFVQRSYRVHKADEKIKKLEHASFVFFTTAASVLFERTVREALLQAGMQESLELLAQKLSAHALDFVSFLKGKKDVNLKPIEWEFKIPDLTRDRKVLYEGGLLRLHAFLFTLEDFRVVWNELVAALNNEELTK
jgi:hypothetical protein